MSPFTPVAEVAIDLPAAPVKLDRQIELQRQRYESALTSPSASQDDVAEAHAFLARHAANPAEVPQHRAILGMTAMYTSPETPLDQRERLARVFAQARGVRPRHIFSLWQLRGPGFEVLARALAYALSASGRPPGWWPEWLMPAPGPALLEPELALAGWIAKRRIPFHTLHTRRIGVALSVGVGDKAIREAIMNGATSWWKLSAPDEVRAIASRGSNDIQVAVADRQLRELGGTATNAAELPPKSAASDESGALARWILHRFGEPWSAPGIWQSFSERARQVMEWLLLREEFTKIIDEFGKLAEKDRAEFWPRYLADLRDARLYRTAAGMGVCMMVFESCMIIEFGNTGNAAYVYSAPAVRLRSSAIRAGLDERAFKDKSSLSLGGLSVDFLDSWNHTPRGAWQGGFYRRLLELEIRGRGRVPWSW